jgi:hypothetical protein
VITLRVDVDGIGEVLDVDGVACVGIGNEGTGEEVVIGVFLETDGDSGDKGLEVSSVSDSRAQEILIYKYIGIKGMHPGIFKATNYVSLAKG